MNFKKTIIIGYHILVVAIIIVIGLLVLKQQAINIPANVTIGLL